jgi:hypothetical protein
MTHRKLRCGILVVALTVASVLPARAEKAATVLIVIAATTAAAAIVAVVTLTGLHHRRRRIMITGCVISGDTGMTVTDEEDRKLYALSGDTTGIKPGDRISLLGKKGKAKGPGMALVWEAREVVKDFGACQP